MEILLFWASLFSGPAHDVRELGSPKFLAREAASKRLVGRADIPTRISLKCGMLSPDPEIAERSRRCYVDIFRSVSQDYPHPVNLLFSSQKLQSGYSSGMQLYELSRHNIIHSLFDLVVPEAECFSSFYFNWDRKNQGAHSESFARFVYDKLYMPLPLLKYWLKSAKELEIARKYRE